jgi:uncharacterized membrane protein YcaP (DUF421 family)
VNVILNAVGIYLFLMVVFRIAGRRTMGQLTTFDFVLLLIISEAVQNALVGRDASMTGAMLAVLTLVLLDILLSLVKRRWTKLEHWIDGVPLIIVRDGEVLEERMERARVDREDLLTSAREARGIPSLAGIEHAVLETNGGISVIPKSSSPATD